MLTFSDEVVLAELGKDVERFCSPGELANVGIGCLLEFREGNGIDCAVLVPALPAPFSLSEKSAGETNP